MAEAFTRLPSTAADRSLNLGSEDLLGRTVGWPAVNDWGNQVSDNFRLKDSYGPEIPTLIADMIGAVDPTFDTAGFVATAVDGYEPLELMDRARHIARALARFLPADPAAGIRVLHQSLPDEVETASWTGMTGFVLLPHSFYVAEHGLDCFTESMAFQYDLTKRFTAEFCIRSFLTQAYEPTMRYLDDWVDDPSPHVRRLVSEGTRPRLPWAGRLPRFQQDPTPVVALLDRLIEDPSEYVRRSVANNLNDISKDHPELAVEVARRWLEVGSQVTEGIVRHGLRTLIKKGDSAALAVLGYEATAGVVVQDFSATPPRPAIGESVRLSVTIKNTTSDTVHVLGDVAIDFRKANGSQSRKVFKGAEVTLAPGQSAQINKTVSVRQHTTRTHYPGEHPVAVLLNGQLHPVGSFDLQP